MSRPSNDIGELQLYLRVGSSQPYNICACLNSKAFLVYIGVSSWDIQYMSRPSNDIGELQLYLRVGSLQAPPRVKDGVESCNALLKDVL